MGTLRALVIVCVPVLAGCPTVDLGDTPPGIGDCNPAGGLAYFTQQIWPNYIDTADQATSCVRSGAQCHQQPIDSGGVGFDITLPINYQGNYQNAQPYLNCEIPSSSPLLINPLNVYGDHGGSTVFTTSSPEYEIFLKWFTST